MFSVVIPLYNKKQYIRRCVESVLLQSFTNFQLIIVDDGSTDGSYDELLDISDKRILLLQQENSGVGNARNTGINNAKYEWIAFLDGDDIWYPNHLQELQNIINLYPYSGLISTNYVECNINQIIPGIDVADHNIFEINYFLEASKKLGIVWTSSVAVKYSVVKSVGGFKKFNAGEDLEFWARVALDFPVAISTRVTAVYFRGTMGTMEALNTQKNNNILEQPIKLKELSPPIALLLECMDYPKYVSKRPCIITYINSRVYRCVIGSLYQENIKDAKVLLLLAITPKSLKLKSLGYLFIMPDFLIRKLLVIIKKAYKIIMKKNNNLLDKDINDQHQVVL